METAVETAVEISQKDWNEILSILQQMDMIVARWGFQLEGETSAQAEPSDPKDHPDTQEEGCR